MFSGRVMKLVAVAISVVCLTGFSISPVDATGRVLRSNCPDYDGSASSSTATSASAPSAAEASASDSSDVTIDTPESTTATPEPTTAIPEPTTATPEPTTRSPVPTPAPTAISVDVTLHTTATYSGNSLSLTLTEFNHCYVLDCFDNVAKSANWTAANFYRLGFYNNANCTTSGGAGTFPESWLASASLGNYLPSSIKLLESQDLASTVSGTSSTCPVS